jgi:IPT/TIG domain-containing protein
MPLPQILGVSPSSGSIGSTVTISGESFGPAMRVVFGDAVTGSSAPILSISSTSMTARVPTPPPGFTFAIEPCDGNGDGIPAGTRYVPTPIDVSVRTLDGTSCVSTLSNAFTLTPTNTTCTGDTSTPPLPSR